MIPATTPSTSSKGRILLVDDEPKLLKRYGQAIEMFDYVVIGANDGEEASRCLAEETFDVVISDIGMPGLSGLELLEKAHQCDPDMPVILVTGDPSVQSAIKAVDRGAFRYLIKPLDLDELNVAIGEAVRMRRLARLKQEALDLANAREPEVRADADLAAGLDRAIGSLWMAYQPIVSWKDRSAYAFEALLRSNEPSMPHPGILLAAAERLGRVCELGRAVRTRVSRDIGRCPADNVFVNLHCTELLDDALYSPDAPLSRVAERVVLEITERAALDCVPDAADRMMALRRLGFRIAVDDLGAGYAGLSSFTLIEPEVVKFDMSIVRDVHRSATKLRLIESMTSLFEELGLKIIAEGVELAEERDALVDVGCNLFQGYLFAKPGKPFPPVVW